MHIPNQLIGLLSLQVLLVRLIPFRVGGGVVALRSNRNSVQPYRIVGIDCMFGVSSFSKLVSHFLCTKTGTP